MKTYDEIYGNEVYRYGERILEREEIEKKLFEIVKNLAKKENNHFRGRCGRKDIRFHCKE